MKFVYSLNTVSLLKLIASLDRANKRFAVILDNKDIYHGYISINQLRRLIVSGANENDFISSFNLKNFFFEEEELKNLSGWKKKLTDSTWEFNEPIVIVNDNHKIVKVVTLHELDVRFSKNYNSLKPVIRKKILLIGGGGYLGSILTRKLLMNGFSVRIFDLFIYGKSHVNKIKDDNLEIIHGDIRNIESISSALVDVDSVILLAAVVGDPASLARPLQTIQTNYLATQVIVSACKFEQINRFIYASTCSVYGFSNNLLDEESPMNPVSLYARTKISSENTIKNLVNGNFAPTILRMSTLYGYSPRMRFDLVVNTMTMKAFLDKEILVFGGDQWRPILKVDDAADAYIKVLDSDINLIKGKIYNVGSEFQNFRIKDIAKIVSKSTNGTKIKTLKSNVDIRDYKVSFEKIKKELSFSPELNLEESIHDIYNKLENKTLKNPKDKKYYNHFFDSSEEI